MPMITKATRITDHTSTLIDHIYTNVPEKVFKAGICLADIMDHLPIFCSINKGLTIHNDAKYYRDFSKFRNEDYISDIEKVDFDKIINDEVNKSMNELVN